MTHTVCSISIVECTAVIERFISVETKALALAGILLLGAGYEYSYSLTRCKLYKDVIRMVRMNSL